MIRIFKKINAPNQLLAFAVLSLFFAVDIRGQNAPPAAPIPVPQISAKVDEYMNAAVRVDGFSGSILVARDGQPVINKGYGMANFELNVPNDPNTVFRLGSITKQFTSTAIMMLQERGKLSANDPICKYFPECPQAWASVTIRHLLTHTSGIPSYTGFPDFAKTAVLPTNSAQMFAQLKDKPLESAPGEKYAYNNSGYYLLGSIIEKVSGKTYADFLQENILAPLGMKNTGYDSPVTLIKNRASGYVRQGGGVINASYMDMTIPFAAGAMYSTTGDLLLWDQALYTEKLLSRKSFDEMFTPFKNGYGYGWGIGKRFDRQIISHGGNIYGFASQITRFPADRVTIIVLSNMQSAPAGRIANDLSAIVFGAPYEIPQERKEIAVDAKILEKYVGDYQLLPNVVFQITLADGKLLGQIAGQQKLTLLAESETRFFSRDVSVTITFNSDAQGKVTGMTFNQGGTNLPAPKIK
jgi:CubicO group peptidase (beta-lactamase class C family)